MKTSALFPLFLLFFCGCLYRVSDPDAAKAAAVLELRRTLPEKPLSLKDALHLVPAEKFSAVRCAFAQLQCASGKDDPASLFKKERARIDLNVLLGFFPQDAIVYDLQTLPDCPEEIPHVAAFEKTALICRKDAGDHLELLRQIRQRHLAAVYAQNTQCRCAYVINCIKLAELAGVEFEEIHDLARFETRFDNAAENRKKEQEMKK